MLTRFRGEGLVLAGASAPENEHTWLVFEGGENVEVGRAQPPSFRRVEGVEVLAMSSCHRKRACVLVFERGGGVGVGKTPQSDL